MRRQEESSHSDFAFSEALFRANEPRAVSNPLLQSLVAHALVPRAMARRPELGIEQLRLAQ
jgi:hypothetical protein